MKITILNGDPETKETSFSLFVEELAQNFEKIHQVEAFRLSTMKLQYCIGCWTCWWETPGVCTHHDDAPDIFRSVVNADFLIFASPLIAGFPSAMLKKITDRLIVLFHPYIIVKQSESHHRKRYARYPDFGLVLQKENETDDEDLLIVKDMYDRLAINFHAQLRYMKLTDKDNPKEIAYESCHF